MRRHSGTTNRRPLGLTACSSWAVFQPRKLPPGELLFTRRNGQFVLQATGHPKLDIPFGQDRTVPIFLATLAVQQRSQTVRFRSTAAMLATLGMHNGGKEYRGLVAAFQRIFGSTIFFGSEPTTEDTRLFSTARFPFVSETHIWYDQASSRAYQAGSRENVIVLSDEFFREIIEHPIPTDLEVARLLFASPGALDPYLWISYRAFTAKTKQSIPLFGPQGLQVQLGCTEYSRPRRVQAMLMQWLTVITPACPKIRRMVQVSGDFLELRRADCK